MASPLESQIKKQVASAFKGKLLTGTLRRVSAAAVDSYGDPVPAAATTYAFDGVRESYSARYRAQAGIPAEDVQFLVLLGSVKPATAPLQGDQIKLSNTDWHQVREIPEVDPAGATAKLQCFVIASPE